MQLQPKRHTLVAVDTNVLLHLAEGLDHVWDAVSLIRTRLASVEIIIPPTTGQELAYIADRSFDQQLRVTAMTAFQKMVFEWRFHLMNFIPVGHGIVEQIAAKLCREKLIPNEEMNDALILAEAALLNCRILLTSDAHLRSIDHQQLTLLLQSSDVSVPLIATPREIVRKFS